MRLWNLKPEHERTSRLCLDSPGERTLKIVCNFDGLNLAGAQSTLVDSQDDRNQKVQRFPNP